MGLSLNPIEVWKLFSERRTRNKEKIATWLDEIAAQAASLAKVWEAYVLVLNNGQRDLPKWAKKELALSKAPNAPYYYQLAMFYRDASRVIGGRVKRETLDNLVYTLGSILSERETTKKKCQKALESNLKHTFFFDDTNRVSKLRDLSASVEALQKEAAALRVLAVNFRAS